MAKKTVIHMFVLDDIVRAFDLLERTWVREYDRRVNTKTITVRPSGTYKFPLAG